MLRLWMPVQAARFHSHSLYGALPVKRRIAIQSCLKLRGKDTGEQPVPSAGRLVYIARQPESQKGNSGVIRIASSRSISNV
jgi:hypothetical protein